MPGKKDRLMTEQPNIILITADQLRWDALGCYGNPTVKTPNIDRLAESGVRFANAYAAATLCVPSRQSILTGQYPSAHGATRNRSAIPEGTPTIASALKANGYYTAAIGKMHFYPPYARYGFDHMALAEQDGEGRESDDYHSRYLHERNLRDRWDEWDQIPSLRQEAPTQYWENFGATTSTLSKEHYHTTWVGEQSARCIQEQDRPFFIWTSFIKPHHPFDPPVPYDTMYDPSEVYLPPPQSGWQDKPLLNMDGDPRQAYFDTRKMTESQLRYVCALYYGLITQIDDEVGRIVAALESKQQLDNTLIVFTSDHGDYMGQYGLFLKHPNIPYDAIARIPLIVSGQGIVHQHEPIAEVVSLIDLLPTFAELSQTEYSAFYQGQSLVKPLHGLAEAALDRRAVLMETESDTKAIRTTRYKYVYSRSAGIEELYDVESDPFETKNVATEQSDVVAQHRQMMLNMLIDSCWDRYGARSDAPSSLYVGNNEDRR